MSTFARTAVIASSGAESERDNMCVVREAEESGEKRREEERGGEAIPHGTSLTLPATNHQYLTHEKEQFVS